MVQKLLQVKAHVILCLRAEEKIEMVKKEGKLVVQPKQSMTGKDGWIPVCDKNLPFEATCSFLLLAGTPGVPFPIKLQEQHKTLFPLDKPITEESGRLLSAWAAGGAPKQESLKPTSTSPASAPSGAPSYVTPEQALELEAMCTENEIPRESFFKAAKVTRFGNVLAEDYAQAKAWISKRMKK